MVKYYIGTSGWLYKHWKGTFYPNNLKQKDWFKHYQNFFDTVELNNTFYRLPKKETFISWRDKAKKNFVFALKANRFITHIKKLKDSKKPFKNMMEHFYLLKEHLGPVLIQLPPNFKKNLNRLKEFVSFFPNRGHFVFEFRDSTWNDREVLKFLKEQVIGFCINDYPEIKCPPAITASFSYIRFHGSGTLYGGDYPEKELEKWVKFISKNKDITFYVYFNNDQFGYAVKNAKQLKKMLD